MKQARKNPVSNFNISTDTFTITSTGASGTINVSTDISALETGDSFLLSLSSGSAEGFTDGQEYWIIPVSSGVIRIADSKEDAFDGTYISGASGDAGVGTAYPNYKVGGIMKVNASGTVYIRGIENRDRGWSSFSIDVTAVNGTILPFMIKDVATSGLTASNLVSWQ